MDVKTGAGTTHTLGMSRFKYLDFANDCYANARELLDYRKAIGFLDAFEFTLEPGCDAKKELMRKKEQVETDKKEEIRKWEQWKSTLNYLEQYDIQPARDKIEVKAIGEMIEFCFDISHRFGLFND